MLTTLLIFIVSAFYKKFFYGSKSRCRTGKGISALIRNQRPDEAISAGPRKAAGHRCRFYKTGDLSQSASATGHLMKCTITNEMR
jgi:hypothetical protein